MLKQAAHEYHHGDVRCLLLAPLYTWAGDCAGLDGGQTKPALGIRQYTPEAFEIVFEQFLLRVVRVRILAIRIRLPGFDHRINHRLAVAIDYAPADGDTLTGHARGCNIANSRFFKTNRNKRPDSLRSGEQQTHCLFSIGVASRPRRMMSKR